MIFPFTLLGTLSCCVYIDLNGSDQIDCGIKSHPCMSLSYTINNVSRPNDKICLIASPIRQISYRLEKTIVIRHSLIVTKSPLFSLNPVIIYPITVTSNWKSFYAFTTFRSADADEILSLKIKSVNFNVNIFTALYEGKRHPLSLSITDSIISSPNHAVHLTNLSGYENVSILVKDSIIQNGRFILNNKRGSCKPLEHARNIVEMSNATIVNKGIVGLRVSGCFNVSINKLKCSNITWKIKKLLMFEGSSLNLKNILIENVLADNNEGKALFLIYKCAMDIQNVIIKNCKSPSSIMLRQTFAVFFVQNSLVKMRDMKVIGNSMKTFMFGESKSHIFIQNSVFINNYFIKAIYNISKNSTLEINNSTFLQNNMLFLLNVVSKSSAIIQNNTLDENTMRHSVYILSMMSAIQLNDVTFTRNNIKRQLLRMGSKCTAIIQNNTLTENIVARLVYFVFMSSSIQLNDMIFTRNNIGRALLEIMLNCSAIIQNTRLIENSVTQKTYVVYYITGNEIISGKPFACVVYGMSSIQLNNVTFTRNNFKEGLLHMTSNSSAIIQNNALTGNNLAKNVYNLYEASTIQLNDVEFTRNNIKGRLLDMASSCSAIIQNSIIIENKVEWNVYVVSQMSSIQLYHVRFTQNTFKGTLLVMESNCSATIRNNTIIGNNMHGTVFEVHASNFRIDTITLHNNTLTGYLMLAISSGNISLNLMRIKENRFKSGIIRMENCAGMLANTYIRNYDHFSVSCISVTCSYEGQKCFSFEFTNITIIWNNKLLLSVRPIIELTGIIFISNVSVLVASTPKIEVIRYSAKKVIKKSPFYLKFRAYLNVYKISSLFIQCRRAIAKHIAAFDTVTCTPCAEDKYTLDNGSIKISSRKLVNKAHEFHNERRHFTCSDCPAGGNCTEYVKSKSNFYGYKTKQQEVEFVPCPWNFCCSGDLCKAIDSCNKRRTGTLCGRCSKSNTESFLSTNCVSVNSCHNFAKFWLIYCIHAFSLATCLYYMKDLIVLMKTTGSKVSNVFKCFLKVKESEFETELVIEVEGPEEHLGKISNFTVSGIFALLVSFYQIKQVIAVDLKYKNASSFSFLTFISKFINLEIIVINSSSYCPMNNLNTVSEALIKTYLLTAALIISSLVNYFVSLLYYSFGGKLGRNSSLKPSDRLGICFIRVLMLNYKNMASVSLILLNCVELAGIGVLHVKGDTDCFQWWQIIVAVFFFTWILFFPLSLKLSYVMFMKDEISFSKFIICLMIPLTLVVYKVLNRNVVSVALQKPINESYVKRILKEMFEEPYRFKKDESSGGTIFYETWRLYQRVLLAIIATYFINPFVRITCITPIIILIAISYRAYRPYKPEMYVLHWMEIVSNMGFFVCLIHNMFRAFLYVYDINYVYPVTIVWEVFNYLDLLFSPIWVLICVFIVKPIYKKAKDAIRKRM